MKKHALIEGVIGLLLVCGVLAQGVTPTTPKRMITRPTGGGSTGGISIVDPPADPKVRHTTHLVLTESRQWTSTDGRTLQAKLLAFEDIVVETPKDAQPAAPVLPATVTVIRGGKIRLVSDQKPFELALDRLSQADRDFVAGINAAHAKKPAAPAP
jgi:hypothetical protein